MAHGLAAFRLLGGAGKRGLHAIVNDGLPLRQVGSGRPVVLAAPELQSLLDALEQLRIELDLLHHKLVEREAFSIKFCRAEHADKVPRRAGKRNFHPGAQPPSQGRAPPTHWLKTSISTTCPRLRFSTTAETRHDTRRPPEDHSAVETIEAELKAGARLNAAPYDAIEPGRVREVGFELVKTSLGGLREVVEALKVDGKVWAVFYEHAKVHTLLEDAQSGSGLRMALEAQVNWMTNDYHHAPCDAS